MITFQHPEQLKLAFLHLNITNSLVILLTLPAYHVIRITVKLYSED